MATAIRYITQIQDCDDFATLDAVQFVTVTATGYLTNERMLTGTANQITVTDGGAGAAVTLSIPAQLALPTAGIGGGILIGGDVLLYRGAADQLQTPDSVRVEGTLAIGGAAILSERLIQAVETTMSSTSAVYGININVIKTAGATDYNDDMVGSRSVMTVDQGGGEVGFLYGGSSLALLSDGTVGNAVSGARTAYGSFSRFAQGGGTVTDDAVGGYTLADLNSGTVSGNAYGVWAVVDQEAASTVSGDIYGNRVTVDADGTVTGTVYMLYLTELTGVDYGIYQNGSADNHLGGALGIGIAVPTAQLHVDQASTTAAIPVLYLDQADLSEEMIEFNTTIGVGNPIEAVGAKALTTTHFVRVTVTGVGYRYFPVGTIA